MGHKRTKKEQSAKRQNNEIEEEEEEEEVPAEQPIAEKKTKKSKKKKPNKEWDVKAEPVEITPPVAPAKKERKKREKKAKHHEEVLNAKLEEPGAMDENNVEEAHEINDSTILEDEPEPVITKVNKVGRPKKNNNVEEEKSIDWPEKDLSELLKRIQAVIPEKDTLAYGTRVEKLSWDDIAFKNYTAEECKSTWLLVQKRLRRFRLLSELVTEAKEWISKPWTNFYSGHKNKRHPDMPRKPLTIYMLFYLNKRDKIIAENPGLEVTEISKIITQMYRALSPEKKEKYMKEAAEKRRIYDMEIEEFYRQHPEISRTMDKQSHGKQTGEPGPKKPNTPFNLYLESQLKSLDQNVYVDKHNFKEQCKEQWKNMSDKKKVIWINWALEEEAKYLEELKNYISLNPDFVPSTTKPVITKEEKLIKERMAGKPVKPPNSAYSLFSRMMLQGDAIKYVVPKDRMQYIAEKWKNCTEDERKVYSEQIVHIREQYKLDFASYLESLPEEKRQEEIRNTLPKRKRSISKNDDVATKKKKEEESITENNNKLKKGKQEEEDAAKKEDEDKKKDKKLTPFAKPPYWNRMKKEEKRTFKNAMLKLKEHLDSRFEKYINDREEESSGDESEDSNESAQSSSQEESS